MEPKTEWGNPTIEIKNGDKWEPLAVQECNSLTTGETPSPARACDGLCRSFKKLSLSFTIANAQMRDIMRLFFDGRRLPAIRFRTGITPKRGRSRRKQRLTRQQRRQKRQRR